MVCVRLRSALLFHDNGRWHTTAVDLLLADDLVKIPSTSCTCIRQFTAGPPRTTGCKLWWTGKLGLAYVDNCLTNHLVEPVKYLHTRILSIDDGDTSEKNHCLTSLIADDDDISDIGQWNCMHASNIRQVLFTNKDFQLENTPQIWDDWWFSCISEHVTFDFTHCLVNKTLTVACYWRRWPTASAGGAGGRPCLCYTLCCISLLFVNYGIGRTLVTAYAVAML